MFYLTGVKEKIHRLPWLRLIFFLLCKKWAAIHIQDYIFQNFHIFWRRTNYCFFVRTVVFFNFQWAIFKRFRLMFNYKNSHCDQINYLFSRYRSNLRQVFWANRFVGHLPEKFPHKFALSLSTATPYEINTHKRNWYVDYYNLSLFEALTNFTMTIKFYYTGCRKTKMLFWRTI